MSANAEIPPPLPPLPATPEAFETEDETELPSAVKAWIAAAHLLPLFAYMLYWIPGSGVILVAPLVVRRFRGALHPLIGDQALQAFQFQVAAAALAFLLGLTLVGWLLAWFVVAASAVFAVLATARACGGERYRYPWTPRLIE